MQSLLNEADRKKIVNMSTAEAELTPLIKKMMYERELLKDKLTKDDMTRRLPPPPSPT